MDMPREWATHRVAMEAARLLAQTTGVRQRVVLDDGIDPDGWYRFRIMPVVAEPCS